MTSLSNAFIAVFLAFAIGFVLGALWGRIHTMGLLSKTKKEKDPLKEEADELAKQIKGYR